MKPSGEATRITLLLISPHSPTCITPHGQTVEYAVPGPEIAK